MRRLTLACLVVLAFRAPAEATLLQLEVTYTDGEIVFGPLTPDLNGQLPASVLASFLLSGPVNIPGDTSFDTADVVTASLVFGDAAWSEGELQNFETSINIGFFEFPFVTSLTYGFNCPPPPDPCRLAANFPLEISGTDDVTGDPYLYRYNTSVQTVTEVVPEPSSLALAALGFAAVAAWRLRRAKPTRLLPHHLGDTCRGPIGHGLWLALSIPIAVSAFALPARAVTSDLASGTSGSLLLNQSFNGETRAAEVSVLGTGERVVLSMTVTGVDIVVDPGALVGARIYDGAGVAVASADLFVPIGENQTITIPISGTLLAGATYRLAFFVPPGATGNTGDLFDPDPPGAGGFGYVESQGLFVVGGGFQTIGDSYPTTASFSTIPRISLEIEIETEPPPPGSGDLFVTKHWVTQFDDSDVIRVDSETGVQAAVTSALGGTGGIVREASGQLLVADWGAGSPAVMRVNPVTGASAVVSQGGFLTFGSMFDLELGPSGEIYLIEVDVGEDYPAQLIRIDPVSGAQEVVLEVDPTLNELSMGLGVEPDGSLLVALSDLTSFDLVRIDPDTGNQEVVSPEIDEEFPADIEVEPSGTILFCDYGDPGNGIDSRLVRVDPATGSQTVLSTGGLLNRCSGIAVDASSSIWVSAGFPHTASGSAAILRVDPVTGAQTLVASGGILDSPLFLVADGAVACGDGADNDGDGFVDTADPGCSSPADGSELSAIACDDGIDNDGDGFTDFDPDLGEGDPQCVGPNDNREAPTKRCGLGFELVPALLALAWASRRRSRSSSSLSERRSPLLAKGSSPNSMDTVCPERP